MNNKICNSEFVARRLRFLAQMEENSVAIFAANKEVTRSNDTEYPFRQNSDFQYVTGFPEPDAWVVLEKTSKGITTSLICRVKDKLSEIWHGRRIGKEQAKTDFEFDQTFDDKQLNGALFDAVNQKDILYWGQGADKDNDDLIFTLLNELRSGPKKGWAAPTQIFDTRPIIHEMRLIKSPAEIAVMRQAGQISADAHKRAMRFAAKQIRSKMPLCEYHLEAEIHHEFAMNGAKHPAYGTIVGGGENACILHYTENDAEINPNDMVLIDAGCELHGYAADITRTYPVGGVFSDEQKAIYELVLQAQQAVLDEIKPGVTLKLLTELSVKVITKGLVNLGILTGEVDELIKNSAHRAYYMHGLSHWLGLDVHDVGQYEQAGNARPLQPGMVFTVEPGIYIDSESDCDAKWHGIGVRIEDNIVITEQGFENLTESAPKSVADIEQLMAQ